MQIKTILSLITKESDFKEPIQYNASLYFEYEK